MFIGIPAQILLNPVSDFLVLTSILDGSGTFYAILRSRSPSSLILPGSLDPSELREGFGAVRAFRVRFRV